MFAKRSKIKFIYKFVMYNYEHVECKYIKFNVL